MGKGGGWGWALLIRQSFTRKAAKIGILDTNLQSLCWWNQVLFEAVLAWPNQREEPGAGRTIESFLEPETALATRFSPLREEGAAEGATAPGLRLVLWEAEDSLEDEDEDEDEGVALVPPTNLPVMGV